MVSYYKTIENKVTEIEKCENGCWINCIAPTEDEINTLIKTLNIEPDFFRASLDEEESSHIDSEEGVTLIIIDIPVVEKIEKSLTYSTTPMGLMITEKNVLTVSLKDNPIISEFAEGVVKDIKTNFKTHFVLSFMWRMASKYQYYLKQIDKIYKHIESELRKSMRNKELMQLLEIEKSLVYFSSSLKSNEITLDKVARGRMIKLYDEDQDLLDDVLIEVKQAIEMSTVFLNILTGTMDAFSSIISNNLNDVMKVLASITLIFSIPTVVSGLYGMNVDNLPLDHYWWFPCIFAAIIMIIAFIILKKKDMI